MEDAWADPVSEYLGAVKTNEVYALYGMTGLVHPDEIPDRPVVLSKGDAHYHLRAGGHDLRLEDWNRYLDFIDKH